MEVGGGEVSRAGAAGTSPPPPQPRRRRHDSAASAVLPKFAVRLELGGTAARARVRAAERLRLAGKRGRGRPGEEGFLPSFPPYFPFPWAFWAARRGPLPAGGGRRREQGAGLRGSAERDGPGPGREQGGARGPGGRGPGGSLARVPGGGRAGEQGPCPGYESDSRVPSPGPPEAPWKKLKCRGLVGPAGGVLRLAGPRGLHLRSPTWVRARRATRRQPRGPDLPSPPGLGAAGRETLAKFSGSFGLWLGASPGPQGNPEQECETDFQR